MNGSTNNSQFNEHACAYEEDEKLGLTTKQTLFHKRNVCKHIPKPLAKLNCITNCIVKVVGYRNYVMCQWEILCFRRVWSTRRVT